jgi:hypothetical protein
MMRALVLVLAGCGGVSSDAVSRGVIPPPPPADASVAIAIDAVVEPVAAVDAAAAPASAEVWLRGSTHVHSAASGDSKAPIPDVIAWYETHGYDFIALTDHNQITELDPHADTTGSPAIRVPATGLIVFAGVELTHNPWNCSPVLHPTKKCRIHVNLIGTTERPGGRFDWVDRSTRERIAKYQSAITASHTLGGITQMNHPGWFWGITPELLVDLAQRGMVLYEVMNAQLPKWNRGDKDHPSTEAVWDAALQRGARIWAVASDDAHDFGPNAKYHPGGAWIVVRARRDPQAILDSIAAGRFYASTGVALEHAEVVNNELVVELAPNDTPSVIELVENGKVVDTVAGTSARRAVPATGYVRAVVTRADGAKAWIQPARR